MPTTEEQTREARERWEKLRANPVALDLTRGKPCPEQLDLSRGLLTALGPDDFVDADGNDCRNYGIPDGIREARELFGGILDLPAGNVIVDGNSSLTLMYEAVSHAVLQGVPGGSGPWGRQQPRFLCPVPGYDRHFALTEHLGIEMTTVGISEAGLDVESVQRLAAEDERVKGIWLVPKYSNPTGVTLSGEAVRVLATMKAAAPDFRILWDNAYVVHDLGDQSDELANVLAECGKAGCPDRVWVFGSTSKISFAGGGLAAFGGSDANVAWMRKHHGKRTIGPDKLNQLRHVRFFGNAEGVRAHMKRQAEILRPKFEVVESTLQERLGGSGLARWTRPRGGYFVSLDTGDGLASRVVAMAAEVGVKLTPAGATFPYGKDPNDRNIRISPTFPSLSDLEQAIDVLATAILCAQ